MVLPVVHNFATQEDRFDNKLHPTWPVDSENGVRTGTAPQLKVEYDGIVECRIEGLPPAEVVKHMAMGIPDATWDRNARPWSFRPRVCDDVVWLESWGVVEWRMGGSGMLED